MINFTKSSLSISNRKFFSTLNKPVLGFVGLGHMGSKMVRNLAADGYTLHVFDQNEVAISNLSSFPETDNKVFPSTLESLPSKCDVILSMLPNDEIVSNVSQKLVENSKKKFTHISCSTISPSVAQNLQKLHSNSNSTLISAPVFARPDGLLKRQAVFMISGTKEGRDIAKDVLRGFGRLEDLGDEISAANVVKLCGNFLIASSIESISEAMALSEKNGVDRHRVMDILSTSIFDCLIYKGYGQRVSQRDHRPGGFSLELGYKDVSLVNKAARESLVPMPVLSTLVDRFTSARAKGRGDYDWSAIGLSVAEDAGIDISKDLERAERDLRENNQY